MSKRIIPNKDVYSFITMLLMLILVTGFILFSHVEQNSSYSAANASCPNPTPTPVKLRFLNGTGSSDSQVSQSSNSIVDESNSILSDNDMEMNKSNASGISGPIVIDCEYDFGGEIYDLTKEYGKSWDNEIIVVIYAQTIFGCYGVFSAIKDGDETYRLIILDYETG